MRFPAIIKRLMPLRAARKAVPATGVSQSLSRILRPAAAYRWMLPSLSAITPEYIELVMRGAMMGNIVQQWELFDLMEDTWPRLAKNANQLKNEVVSEIAGWSARAFQEEEAAASDSAKEKARLVNNCLQGMRPRADQDENGFSQTIYDLMDAWFKGIVVLETDWELRQAGKLGQITAPRCTQWVHPICYAWHGDGWLGLRTAGMNTPTYVTTGGVQNASNLVEEFPPDKFLVGLRKAKSGSPIAGALLRPLAWWWCCANFSADWLLNLAQIFGLPFRWANYDPSAPQATIDKICSMLQNMGSNAWAAFPAGTTMELKEATKTGKESPSGDLLDRADKNCDLLVLGQTLTSDVSGGKGSGGIGGRALGEVHERVEEQIKVSACNYVVGIFNNQLIPSILSLNYGEGAWEDERPLFKGDEEEPGTLEFKRDVFKAMLTDSILSRLLANQTDIKQLSRDIGLPINEDYDGQEEELTVEPEPAPPPKTPNPTGGNRGNGETNGNGKPVKPEKPALEASGRFEVPIALNGSRASIGAPAVAYEKESAKALARALQSDLSPIASRIQAILKIEDPAILESKLKALMDDVDALKRDLGHDPEIAAQLYKILSGALANGLATKIKGKVNA